MTTKFRISSGAIMRCRFALYDVKSLLALHSQQRQLPGMRPERLDYLKRAAVILCVTAWETFVEDLILCEGTRRIESAKAPSDVEDAFKSLTASALDTQNVARLDLAAWTGSGWKKLLDEKLRRDVSRLNSPTSVNIRRLSKPYLGFDITKHWQWSGMSHASACAALDRVIELRGDLVHQSKEAFSRKTLSIVRVRNARNLLGRLAERTEVVVRKHFHPNQE